MVIFSVRKRKIEDLINIIIPHFEKYPLLTPLAYVRPVYAGAFEKAADSILFKQINAIASALLNASRQSQADGSW